MKKLGWIAFFIAFFIGTILAGIFVTRSYKGENFFGQTKGSGISATENRDVSTFTKIDAGSAVQIEIIAQTEQSVEVTADDNILPKVKTEVRGETLHIFHEGKIWTRNPVKIKISMKNLDALEMSGASRADVSNVASEGLNIDASGASKITVSGSTHKLIADLSGASRLDAKNLATVKAFIEASGASSAIVNVADELDAKASGASNITYLGEPKNLRKKASGASSISQR